MVPTDSKYVKIWGDIKGEIFLVSNYLRKFNGYECLHKYFPKEDSLQPSSTVVDIVNNKVKTAVVLFPASRGGKQAKKS